MLVCLFETGKWASERIERKRERERERERERKREKEMLLYKLVPECKSWKAVENIENKRGKRKRKEKDR